MCDILIKNASVLTMGEPKYIAHGYVHISDGIISAVGAGDYSCDAQVIDAGGQLVMPGLINAHTHLPMTMFRGFADDLPLQQWLEEIWKVEDRMTGEDIYWCSKLALLESIACGVTTVSDMYFQEEWIAQAVKEAGIRAVLSRSIVAGDNMDLRFKEAEDLYRRWHGCEGRITTAVAPHAEYTNTDESVKECIEFARRTGTGMHVHLSETVREVSECIQRHGCSPVVYFDSLGFFEQQTLAAHCVVLSKEDMHILARRGVSVAHNPGSNLKLASGVAPVPAMMQEGINVALGSDGAGSNNSLDIWRELYLASVLHKGFLSDATAVTAQRALETATVNGAKALGINAGSIEVGKEADLIMVDMSSLWFKPENEIEKLLVYSGTRANVLMTMVKGNILYQNGTFKSESGEEIIEHVEKIRKRLIQ